MSWQATQVVDDLPYDYCKPLAFRVLLKLANVADAHGRNAWGFRSILAEELGVDPRSIQRAFAELEALNLIRPGDQRSTRHFQANRRPRVFDIVMSAGQGGQPTFEDGLDDMNPEETPGETEFSTPHVDKRSGETAGEVTHVAHKNDGTNYSSKRVTTGSARARVSARECEHGHAEIADTRYCIYGDPVREKALA